MKNNAKLTTTIRRVSTPLLLIAVFVQSITVLVMSLGFEEIEEIHELCGIVFFVLVLIHFILFRKLLMKLIFPAKS